MLFGLMHVGRRGDLFRLSMHSHPLADDDTNTKTVKFNVGGKANETSRSLFLWHEDTMLARLVSDRQMDPTETIFIDRDGEIFRFVLNFLR